MISPGRFVVGVDGSEGGLHALRWAVAEAGQHGAELVAVTTWTALPPPIVSPTVDVSTVGGDRGDAPAAAERALQSVLTEALANNPQIAVQTVATEGDPAKILTEQSKQADLVVVGARGRGRVAGWLLGSVSQELLRHSSCTVAVIRPPHTDKGNLESPETSTSERSSIVVGIDGSASSKSALRWAAEEAKSHNAELTVVSVWTPAPTVGPYDSLGWAAGLEPEQLAAATLDDTVEEVLSEYPGLAIRREVRGGNAVAKVLVDRAGGADVLVIGSRGLGGFVGMLLGSVSQDVSNHADCTVVVVRDPTASEQ